MVTSNGIIQRIYLTTTGDWKYTIADDLNRDISCYLHQIFLPCQKKVKCVSAIQLVLSLVKEDQLVL